MPSTGNEVVTNRLLAKSFGVNSGAVFPDTFLDEYKTLEYIENSNSQWIDTGVNGESTVIIQTKFLITDTSNTGVIVGYYYNPTENLRFFGANNLFYTDMGSDSTGRIYGGTLAANQIYEIESGNLYMKDLTTGQMIAEGNKVPYFSQNHTMTIFYFNNGAPAKGRMYYLNLYKGSKIVRKYIPVKRISDSRIGMYDLVEQKFYESSGNGHFTGGPETTLSDLSTVLNKVPRLYQVRKFLKRFNLPALSNPIPDGYSELQYVHLSGSQCVKTNFKPNQDTRCVVKFKATGTNPRHAALFGARSSGTQDAFSVWLYSDGALIGPQYGDNVAFDAYPINVGTYLNRLLTYDFNRGVLSVDGKYVTITNSPFTANCPIAVGSINSGGYADSRMAIGDLYSAQIYNNGTLVCDLVPVKRKADNVAGMYDRTNEIFYISAAASTSGNFTAGPEKWKDISDLNNRVLSLSQLNKLVQEYGKNYIKLEYLTFNGSQFINTGFMPKSTSRIQLEVDLEDMGDKLVTLFGGRTSLTVASFSMWRMSSTIIRWDYGTRQTSITFPTTVGKFVIDADKNTVTINSTKRSVTAQTFTSNTPLRISSNYTTGGSQYNDENYNDLRRFSGDLYYFKIYDNDVLVRDFIPAKRKSDGTLGLYDLVTDVFYTNDGFGMFTSGPEVGYV